MAEQPVPGDYRICARCGIAEPDDQRHPRGDTAEA
jgi:hypothetical protein